MDELDLLLKLQEIATLKDQIDALTKENNDFRAEELERERNNKT